MSRHSNNEVGVHEQYRYHRWDDASGVAWTTSGVTLYAYKTASGETRYCRSALTAVRLGGKSPIEAYRLGEPSWNYKPGPKHRLMTRPTDAVHVPDIRPRSSR